MAKFTQEDIDSVDTISWSYDKYEPEQDEYETQEEYNDLVNDNSTFSLECSNENKGIHFYVDANQEELEMIFDNDVPNFLKQEVLKGKTQGYISDIQMWDATPSNIDDVNEVNKIAKRIFPTESEYYPGFRGYLLTDGTLLEFGDNTDHVSIGSIDGMTVGKFVSLGNIRLGKDSIDLEKEPTQQQERVLTVMISYLEDKDLYVDIKKYSGEGTYSTPICGKHYSNPSPRRVLGEIRQYFREGLRLCESVNKEAQLAIILSTNPMHDDYHTGIRGLGDIKEYGETLLDKNEISNTPDFSYNDSLIALQSGKITIFSSYNIKPGVFVSPSKMIAKDFSGGGKIYSKTVELDEVAWITNLEGQYTGKGINESERNIISEEISAADEIIKNGKLNFHSFEPKETLSPDIFDENLKMRNDVRNELIYIIKDIFNDCDGLEDYMVDDIVLVGSLASYHYSSYSDIDLHFVVYMDKFNDDPEAARDILKEYRTVWNKEHKISVAGFEVELYFNDISDKNVTNGIYSIVENEWVNVPSKENYVIDKEKLETKAIDYITEINSIRRGDEAAEELWNKIKEKRKSSLSEVGEFADDNILFKILRRTGYLEKLNNKRPKRKKEVVMVDDILEKHGNDLGEWLVDRIKHDDFTVDESSFYGNIDIESKDKFTDVDLILEKYSVSDEVYSETERLIEMIISDMASGTLKLTPLGFHIMDGDIENVDIFGGRYQLKHIKYNVYIFQHEDKNNAYSKALRTIGYDKMNSVGVNIEKGVFVINICARNGRYEKKYLEGSIAHELQHIFEYINRGEDIFKEGYRKVHDICDKVLRTRRGVNKKEDELCLAVYYCLRSEKNAYVHEIDRELSSADNSFDMWKMFQESEDYAIYKTVKDVYEHDYQYVKTANELFGWSQDKLHSFLEHGYKELERSIKRMFLRHIENLYEHADSKYTKELNEAITNHGRCVGKLDDEYFSNIENVFESVSSDLDTINEEKSISAEVMQKSNELIDDLCDDISKNDYFLFADGIKEFDGTITNYVFFDDSEWTIRYRYFRIDDMEIFNKYVKRYYDGTFFSGRTDATNKIVTLHFYSIGGTEKQSVNRYVDYIGLIRHEVHHIYELYQIGRETLLSGFSEEIYNKCMNVISGQQKFYTEIQLLFAKSLYYMMRPERHAFLNNIITKLEASNVTASGLASELRRLDEYQIFKEVEKSLEIAKEHADEINDLFGWSPDKYIKILSLSYRKFTAALYRMFGLFLEDRYPTNILANRKIEKELNKAGE